MGDGRREHVEIFFVELQLFVVEIDVGENLVLLKQEIADDRSPRSSGRCLDQAAMAFVEEIHLRAEGRAGLLLVKIGEKRIVVAVGDPPRVQLLGQALWRASIYRRGWALRARCSVEI